MEDIHDIKGFVPVPHNWWWLLLVIPALLIVWWFCKRKQPAAPAVTLKVQLTPFEIALAALQRLREQNLPVEQFYTRLSDIVRQYIEGQFGLRAPERTTEEFLAEASLLPEHLTLLGAFLRESD